MLPCSCEQTLGANRAVAGAPTAYQLAGSLHVHSGGGGAGCLHQGQLPTGGVGVKRVGLECGGGHRAVCTTPIQDPCTCSHAQTLHNLGRAKLPATKQLLTRPHTAARPPCLHPLGANTSSTSNSAGAQRLPYQQARWQGPTRFEPRSGWGAWGGGHGCRPRPAPHQSPSAGSKRGATLQKSVQVYCMAINSHLSPSRASWVQAAEVGQGRMPYSTRLPLGYIG